MPTYTAITLDMLVEPREKKPNQKPLLTPVKVERAVLSSSEKSSIPLSHPSPALYATPLSTPLPDSPSLFPPSPYIINHKRRGPRLLKSSQLNNVGGCQLNTEVGKVALVNECQGEEVRDSIHDEKLKGKQDANGQHATPDDPGSYEEQMRTNELEKFDAIDLERNAECEGFFYPQNSTSTASNAEFDDSYILECSWKPCTPQGEFFDACEEIYSDGTPSCYRNFEDELCNMRQNLLMEIERRKQAEEAIGNLEYQWLRLRHQLSVVGLTLPAPPSSTKESSKHSIFDPVNELCQQVIVARMVAASIGRGCSRAEIELKMEPLMESKNFEIARLRDRLQYYEAANREMSQRNQEAVETARQQRLKRKRRQKWLWSLIGLAATIGAASLAWSYFSDSNPSCDEGEAET